MKLLHVNVVKDVLLLQERQDLLHNKSKLNNLLQSKIILQ
jgi:hypothetical protein